MLQFTDTNEEIMVTKNISDFLLIFMSAERLSTWW